MANWGEFRDAVKQIRDGFDRLLEFIPADGHAVLNHNEPALAPGEKKKRTREVHLPYVSFTLDELEQLSKFKNLSADQIAEKLKKEKDAVETLLNDYKSANITVGKEVKRKEPPKTDAEPPAKKAKVADGDVSKAKKEPSSSVSPSSESSSDDSSSSSS